METLTLNDGTELNGHILPNGDGLYIYVYLQNMNLMQGFMLFSDPEKTARIVELNHGEENVYEGFTELFSINAEFGNCNIRMKKAAVVPE